MGSVLDALKGRKWGRNSTYRRVGNGVGKGPTFTVRSGHESLPWMVVCRWASATVPIGKQVSNGVGKQVGKVLPPMVGSGGDQSGVLMGDGASVSGCPKGYVPCPAALDAAARRVRTLCKV